jgi:predicted nucleic acid-binding Zn ribbon protein
MESAGRLFGRIKLPGNVVTHEDVARGAWPRAVGKKIASRTQTIALVRRCLVVEVEDALWQRQLNSMRGQILNNLQKAIGTGIVDDIDFRPMGARRSPQRAETASSLAVPGDEAASIDDPIFRRVYVASRKKASA